MKVLQRGPLHGEEGACAVQAVIRGLVFEDMGAKECAAEGLRGIYG